MSVHGVTRGPDFPEIGSEAYARLVSSVACYGWGLGAALCSPSLPLGRSTRYVWARKANAGVEPYASWWPQFLADVHERRQRMVGR